MLLKVSASVHGFVPSRELQGLFVRLSVLLGARVLPNKLRVDSDAMYSLCASKADLSPPISPAVSFVTISREVKGKMMRFVAADIPNPAKKLSSKRVTVNC
jgi:hypothetical protein